MPDLLSASVPPAKHSDPDTQSANLPDTGGASWGGGDRGAARFETVASCLLLSEDRGKAMGPGLGEYAGRVRGGTEGPFPLVL